MKVAFGMKAHSGWAALVVLGAAGGQLHVLDRRRIELVKPGDAEWAKQPYHAAEHLRPEAARDVVRRGVAAARQIAARQMRAVVRGIRAAKHEVAACALLVGDPVPDWSVAEILAVHFRMHRAEGALFRDVLGAAAGMCGITLVPVPEKQLATRAKAAFGPRADGVLARIALLGKSVGPPWGRDQKDATLAAAIALEGWRAAVQARR
jgi:hypothetical protein